MSKPKIEVGTTHQFVLSKGFTRIGNLDALIGADGTKRLFAELFADPDRPDVRPQEAYQAILSSMQPGWTLRLLQTFWPDPAPRLAFQCQAQCWQKPASDELDILHQGLLLSTEQFPLPFGRRTILEFVFPGDEGLAWWEGLGGLCQGFGVRVYCSNSQDIQTLYIRMVNPDIE
ncbi:MAG: hypothetical protein WCK35_25950 [Chloroflexota bacterium]